MVAAALFRLKEDDIARSVSRASRLIRMLTAGEGQLQDIPSLESPTSSKSRQPMPRKDDHSTRKLTWSLSSPLVGFDLLHKANELRDITSYTNLIIKIALRSEEGIPRKVHLLWFLN